MFRICFFMHDFPLCFLFIILSYVLCCLYLTMMAYNYNAQCAVCAPLVVAYSFFSGVGSNDGSKLSFKFHHSNKQDTTHKLLGKRRGGNARLDVLLCTTWRQSSTTFSTTSRKERTFDSIRHSKIAPSSYRSRESREVRTRAKSNNGCREWPMMDESFRTQKKKMKDKILKSPNSVCYWVSFLLLDINKKWNKFSGRCRRHQPWQLSRNNTIIIRVRHRLEYDEKKKSVVFIHLAIRRPSKLLLVSLSLSHICVMSHTFKRDLSCFSFCIFTFRHFTVSSQKIFSPSHNYFYFILFYFFFCSFGYWSHADTDGATPGDHF